MNNQFAGEPVGFQVHLCQEQDEITHTFLLTVDQN